MTAKLNLKESFDAALAACDGKFVSASMTPLGYRIHVRVTGFDVVGAGWNYVEAMQSIVWQLDRMTSLWEPAEMAS